MHETGRRRRYQWDFDPHMDLFLADLEHPTPLIQLTDTPGYDAECSFSPDGKQLLFVSDRDGDADHLRCQCRWQPRETTNRSARLRRRPVSFLQTANGSRTETDRQEKRPFTDFM